LQKLYIELWHCAKRKYGRRTRRDDDSPESRYLSGRADRSRTFVRIAADRV
jgi:hypothetical protein